MDRQLKSGDGFTVIDNVSCEYRVMVGDDKDDNHYVRGQITCMIKDLKVSTNATCMTSMVGATDFGYFELSNGAKTAKMWVTCETSQEPVKKRSEKTIPVSL